MQMSGKNRETSKKCGPREEDSSAGPRGTVRVGKIDDL